MKSPIPLAAAFSLSCLALHAAPPSDATADAIFRKADANADGKVTPDELPNRETFSRFDTNGDGIITWEEAKPVLEKIIAERNPGEPKRTANAGKETGPLRRKLGDFVQRLIDRRTWPKESQQPTSDEKPVIIGAKAIKPGDVGVGRQVPDLSFKTLDGKSHSLAEWSSKPGVVFAFTSATCPVSKRYAPSLARLQKELSAHDIPLVLVDPFPSETPDEIAAQLKEAQVTAPCVHDTDKSLTGTLEARTTTEVFLLDAKRTLIYRGALDDQYGVGYNLDEPRERYLLDAVSAMLSGTRPAIAATEAPGCELDVPTKTAGADTHVTYHRDVARIMQQNCVQCHHDKGIAPFALDEPADVIDRAKTIRRVVESRTMPPWSAAPVPDGQPNPWANDHSLSTRDKTDLLAWLDSKDRPLGNSADAPAPLKFSSEWSIGKPDYIVQLKQPFEIKAEGFMPYQFATVETTLTEDKWVQGYEIMPTAREVVHHVIVNVHEKGARIPRGGGEGESGYWAAYVPGNGSRIFPDGFARKLPAGSTVSFQIHYTPTGKATQDQLRMGLIFAKEPPRYAMHTAGVANHKLQIPPGEANHVETYTRPVPFDMNVTAFVAHMHVRGKSFRYELITTDGKCETLLDIPRYDFNWQLRYELKEPRTLPRGSQVKITAVFDNSPGNKANPDPTRTVRWGQQTIDEMMIGYIEYFTPLPQKIAQK